MSEKKFQWYKIAEDKNELSFAENCLSIVEVNNRKITIAKYHDELFACAYACPHASGILAQGSIDALGNIVCPEHRYKYSLSNGRNVTGEGYYLKTFPIKMNEEGIFVGFEEKQFLNFL